MFYAINMLNNWAFAFSISVPVHIILRSFGSVWTMGAGWIRGKRYSSLQVFSVALLTFGVIASAWADAESKVSLPSPWQWSCQLIPIGQESLDVEPDLDELLSLRSCHSPDRANSLGLHGCLRPRHLCGLQHHLARESVLVALPITATFPTLGTCTATPIPVARLYSASQPRLSLAGSFPYSRTPGVADQSRSSHQHDAVRPVLPGAECRDANRVHLWSKFAVKQKQRGDGDDRVEREKASQLYLQHMAVWSSLGRKDDDGSCISVW